MKPMDKLKKIEQDREERRIKMEEAKREKKEKEAYNMASGKNVDIDFEIMIEKNRFRDKMLAAHVSSDSEKLTVCVRKRPIFKKEEASGEIDSVSCANPQIKILEPKFKVDGITKYVENHHFTFDNTFHDGESTDSIYQYTLKPLIPLLKQQGIVTCFAYGQTGSGKTYTMGELQRWTVMDLFEMTNGNLEVCISFFEIYAGRCLDLLNDKSLLNILEDKNGSIQIPGLVEKSVKSAKELLSVMDVANATRTTHATAANDTSSRSHAICQIFIKNHNGVEQGKLVLVDLAGSERAQDTQSNNRQRRMEGAEINKSLLALKECIRGLGEKADHIPFRASKLTLILRDSFLSKHDKSRVIMIACVSPGSSSADHSLNTLRYADRLKDNNEKHQMFNEMYSDKQDSLDIQNELSKEHLQKIESLKNIKKDENASRVITKPVQPIPIPKAPSNNNSNNNNSGVIAQSSKPSNKKESDTVRTDDRRSNSVKKGPGSESNSISANKNYPKKTSADTKETRPKSEKDKKPLPEEVIEEDIVGEDARRHENQKKAKEDIKIMKETLRGDNKEEFIAFHEKITSILEEQEEVYATHMAAIKEDAKLLAQESELITNVQGSGFMDYDLDTYVDKLQTIVKRKLKMYNLLSKKLENFKKYLTEEEEISHKVKGVYF